MRARRQARLRLRRWLGRYLPPEAAGTGLALSGAWIIHRTTGSAEAAAVAGSLAETAGYYGTIAVRDTLRYHRARPAGSAGRRGLARSAARALRGMAVEFGPAEAADTLLVRPLLMYLGAVLTGNFLAGTLAGKLAADAVFYTIVAPCNAVRRRLFPLPEGGVGAGAVRPPASPDRGERSDEGRRRVNGPGARASGASASRLSTPYLAMDLTAVRRAHGRFRDALPEARVHYAMKCNPDPRVLRCLHAAGASFEIASRAELTELVGVGVDPRTVLYSNPVKPAEHIRDAHAAGVYRFAFDSAEELAKIARCAPGAAVFVRLRTRRADSGVPSEGKFGVPADRAADLLRRAVGLGLRPYGVAFHVGSQMTDPGAWAEPIEATGAVMRALLADGVRLRMLDLGGGFPARYEADNPDLMEYGAHIRTAVERHLPYPVDLVVEPGRALVAEAGVMVATVIGVAERSGTRWAHLDVGAFNGLMEALETGNRLLFPVTDSRADGRSRPYHLTGPTCDSQDTVLFDVPLSESLAAGDVVHIHCAGAYTTGYASRFNGFDIPAVHCVDPEPTPDPEPAGRHAYTLAASAAPPGP